MMLRIDVEHDETRSAARDIQRPVHGVQDVKGHYSIHVFRHEVASHVFGNMPKHLPAVLQSTTKNDSESLVVLYKRIFLSEDEALKKDLAVAFRWILQLFREDSAFSNAKGSALICQDGSRPSNFLKATSKCCLHHLAKPCSSGCSFFGYLRYQCDLSTVLTSFAIVDLVISRLLTQPVISHERSDLRKPAGKRTVLFRKAHGHHRHQEVRRGHLLCHHESSLPSRVGARGFSAR